MEVRSLGRTGLNVSTVAVGTWQLSGPIDLDGRADGFRDPGREAAIRMIRWCGDQGVNLIDCAEVYGDGEGERRVGEALAGIRDQWIIVTKFGLRRGSDGRRIVDAGPQTIRKSLEGSLGRLRTDRVDVLLYHAPGDPRTLDEGRRVLEALRAEGKIRFFGVSTNDPGVLRAHVAHGAEVVMLSQSMLRQPREMIEIATRARLGVLVRGALEWGRLSGRYFHAAPDFGPEDIRRGMFKPEDYLACAAFERLLPAGVAMPALAFRYVLDQPSTHAVVAGSSTPEGFSDALRAAAMRRLDAATHAAIADLRRRIAPKRRRSLRAVVRSAIRWALGRA